MRMIKCNYGHFFDGEKYTECPECENIKMYESTITDVLIEESDDIGEGLITDTLKLFLEAEEKENEKE